MGYIPQLQYGMQDFSGCVMDFRHAATLISDRHPNEEMHLHDCCEIYVNVSGDGTFLVENNLYPVTRGDIVLTAPNEIHHGVWQKGVLHEHYCLWFGVGENAPWMSRFLERRRGERNLLSLSPAHKEKLFSLLARMEQELGEGGDRRGVTLCFLQLMLLIENAVAEPVEQQIDVPRPLADILKELQEGYGEPVRFSDIAERYFISQSTLNRLFHTHLRLSPHAYLEDLRLGRAKQMLAQGCDVTDTALECGFSDCSYFIMLFRRRFGVTPGQYRKARTGEEGRRVIK